MEQSNVSADFSEIVTFVRVVQGGSFTAAGRSLGMPKSTVSRKVSELETRVGARLLQRTTRTVSLTDVGRLYYEHSVRIIAELEEAELIVRQMQSTPSGTLRITAPLSFSVLGPILAEFLDLYPAVQVDLVCTDRRVDLIEERFELALRAGKSPDSSLVASKLGVVRRCFFAAPRLIKRVGSLDNPEQIERHHCVVFAPEGNTWRVASGAKRAEVTVQPRLVANDYDMLRSVVRAGFGFALLPEYQCVEDVAAGRLARVLDPWATEDVPIFALYPSTRHLPPKLVALLDLIRKRLAARLDLG